MRKMFTVGLAAVMAMGLCACGSQKAAETTAAPAAAETTAAPSQDEKKRLLAERINYTGRQGIYHEPGSLPDRRRLRCGGVKGKGSSPKDPLGTVGI